MEVNFLQEVLHARLWANSEALSCPGWSWRVCDARGLRELPKHGISREKMNFFSAQDLNRIDRYIVTCITLLVSYLQI